jgi:hypothetical protein
MTAPGQLFGMDSKVTEEEGKKKAVALPKKTS